VAVEDATTAYNDSGSLPVVGTVTGVLAAIGNPVVVVTPAPPMNAAALDDTRTPSESGALPIVATRVAVGRPILACRRRQCVHVSQPQGLQADQPTNQGIHTSSRSSTAG
jgi:hypothetical protein